MKVKNGVNGGMDALSSTLGISKIPKNYNESKSFYELYFFKRTAQLPKRLA